MLFICTLSFFLASAIVQSAPLDSEFSPFLSEVSTTDGSLNDGFFIPSATLPDEISPDYFGQSLDTTFDLLGAETQGYGNLGFLSEPDLNSVDFNLFDGAVVALGDASDLGLTMEPGLNLIDDNLPNGAIALGGGTVSVPNTTGPEEEIYNYYNLTNQAGSLDLGDEYSQADVILQIDVCDPNDAYLPESCPLFRLVTRHGKTAGSFQPTYGE